MIDIIRFKLNRKPLELKGDGERKLLWVLRSDLGVTGPKYGCGEGLCGACTILINNKATRSCQVPVKEIKIIEVKSEIGAGTRGASLGVEAMKIASLDLKSDLFRKYDSIEVENVNELLFDGAEHSHAKFIDGVFGGFVDARVAEQAQVPV